MGVAGVAPGITSPFGEWLPTQPQCLFPARIRRISSLPGVIVPIATGIGQNAQVGRGSSVSYAYLPSKKKEGMWCQKASKIGDRLA